MSADPKDLDVKDEENDSVKEESYSLYIFKSAPGVMVPAETFLRNRGWNVSSGSNFKELLTYLITKQPQFLMISADHKNKKTRMLPKLLTQAFPVKIIAFAEQQTNETIKVLHDMGLKYTLYPPVSGPAIDRIIRKIQKDLESGAESSTPQGFTGGSSGPTIKGPGYTQVTGSFSSEQAKAALSSFLSSDSDSTGSNNTMTQGGSLIQQGGTIVAKGQASKGGLGYIPSSAINADGSVDGSQIIPSDDGKISQTPNDGESKEQWAARMRQAHAQQNQRSQQGLGYIPPSAVKSDGSIDGSQITPSADGSVSNGPQNGESQAQWNERMKQAYQQQMARAKQSGQGFIPPSALKPDGSIDGSQITPSADGSVSQGPEDGESFEDWSERMRKAAGAAFNQNPNANPNGGTQGADKTQSDSNSEKQRQGIDPNAQSGSKSSGKTNPTMESKGPYGKQKTKPTMDSGYVPKKVKKDPVYKFQNNNKPTKPDTLIIKGTQQAMDESVALTDENKVVQTVEKATNVACITVESTRFNGYLVAAMGKNRKVDGTLLEQIKKRLFSFLKANGEQISETDNMAIKIKEVDFEPWAVQQAEFLRKSVHDGEEIAIAFFPTANTDVKLEESAQENMAKLNIEEIKTDTPLEFDMYVYMEENQKYVRYTAQGGTFYQSQKDRLKEKGVNNLHIRKDSIHDLKRYKAQNYLNDKIAEYKAKLEAKAAG